MKNGAKPKEIHAEALLRDAVARHKINLSVLVADTGLWANPEVHHRLMQDNGAVARYPNVRRANTGKGEKRYTTVNGDIRLDDNTYANVAIKRATGLGSSALGFETCHIWPKTCYDEKYHTAIANIVLLPRALAGLSDHDAGVRASLQYRAFELYGWFPEGKEEWEQEQPPIKPSFYPSTWRNPMDDVLARVPDKVPESPLSVSDQKTLESRRELAARIDNWARRSDLNVHKIIALVVHVPKGISRDELVQQVKNVTSSNNPSASVASLMTDAGNAYGCVFSNSDGLIRIQPWLKKQVEALTWKLH